MPEGARWRYGLILPFQAGPYTGGAFVNVRIRNGVMGHRSEPWRLRGRKRRGALRFRRWDSSGLDPESPTAITTSRNPHSDPPGQTSIMVKYPMRGGFVPLGAKTASGPESPGRGDGVSASAWRWRGARRGRTTPTEPSTVWRRITSTSRCSNCPSTANGCGGPMCRGSGRNPWSRGGGSTTAGSPMPFPRGTISCCASPRRSARAEAAMTPACPAAPVSFAGAGREAGGNPNCSSW